MKPNVVFIHAAILDKCNERVLQFLDKIASSSLVNNIHKIFICFVGNDPVPLNENDLSKYNLPIYMVTVSTNLQDYELPTLQFMYDYCVNTSDKYMNVMYIHTKNVGKEVNPCIEDQVEYMLHFLVDKSNECLESLVDQDACGVDLRTEPILHYSGNFWWATSNHIRSLPSPFKFNDLSKYPNPLNSIRHNQEFWICHYTNKKYYSLWDCGIGVYERHLKRYPKELYI